MKAQKNALEWTVFAISIVLFVALIGYLVYRVVREPASSEAQVEITTGSPEQRGDLWAIPVTLANRGDRTAETFRAEVALQRDGKDVEVAEVNVAFLPRQSRRESWVLFRTDPRNLEVSTRAIAYNTP